MSRALCPLLLLAALGCGGSPTIDGWDEGQIERHYEDAYVRWTRSGHAYEYFEGRAFVHATYWDPEFVEALARYESVRLGHLADGAAEHAVARAAVAKSEERFLICMITQTPFWNDLDRRNATFTVRLIRGGKSIEPTRITKVSLDDAQDLPHFYPRVDPLGSAYWVSFPKGEGDAQPVLRVAGAPARIDLDWSPR